MTRRLRLKRFGIGPECMNTDLIRASSAQWLIKQLGEMGVGASGLMDGAELEDGWLDKEEAFISYPTYRRIITNALDITKDGAIGLKLGQKVNLAVFGAFGYALMSSKTLKDAAGVYLKYQDLPGQLTRIGMEHDGPQRVIRFDPLYPFKGRMLVYAMEEVLSTTYHGMVFLTNQKVDPAEICLSYPAPEHAWLYREMFRCPVRFMATENSMRLNARVFDLPVCTANQGVYEYCTRFCEMMLGGLEKSDRLIDRIRSITLTSPGRFLKTGEMAAELGISPRSLNRRLQERGTSYRKIINEVRRDLSMRYLERTNLSMDQISDLVGFSETTAFRRAFKGWTGRNASQYRKEILAGLKALDLRKSPGPG